LINNLHGCPKSIRNTLIAALSNIAALFAGDIVAAFTRNVSVEALLFQKNL
jgi:hypothetical protein